MRIFLLILLLMIRSAIAAKPGTAKYDAGIAHLHRGVHPDYEKAIELLRESMGEGNIDAVVALADLYSAGYGEPRNVAEKPIALYRRATAAEDWVAMETLEKRLRLGIGTEIDLLEACALHYKSDLPSLTPEPMRSFMRRFYLHNDPNAATVERLDKLFVDGLQKHDQAAFRELAKFHVDGTHGKPNLPRACAFLTIAEAPEAAAMLEKLSPEQRNQMREDLRWMRQAPSSPRSPQILSGTPRDFSR